MLPAGEGAGVRYAYGDWRYYARRKTGAIEASTAVLLPTTAGLGRRELATDLTRNGIREAVGLGIESIHEITVDSVEVARLRRHLDAIFQEALDTRIYNRPYDLHFVHHPEEYTILRNSNRMVALWLRELGGAGCAGYCSSLAGGWICGGGGSSADPVGPATASTVRGRDGISSGSTRRFFSRPSSVFFEGGLLPSKAYLANAGRADREPRDLAVRPAGEGDRPKLARETILVGSLQDLLAVLARPQRQLSINQSYLVLEPEILAVIPSGQLP